MGKLKELLEKLKWSHVAIAVALSAGYAYFMLDQTEIETRTQGIEIAQNEIANLQKKIQEAKEFEKEFEDKKRNYAELVKELQKIQGALPKQFDMAELLSDFLGKAKEIELDITSIKPDTNEATNELYNSLGFSIEAKGTFHQLFIFLDSLANMKRLVSVEAASFERDSGKIVVLGGPEGVFAQTKMSGGMTAYPGLRSTIKLVTYRYRGGGAGQGGGR